MTRKRFGNDGSLYRGLALPFSASVLVSTLILAGWIGYWNREESMAGLRQMAATNAGVIHELRLPRSRDLAGKLSTILGVEVGFYGGDGGPRYGVDGAWSADLRAAAEMAVESAPDVVKAVGHEVAAAAIAETGEHVVLARATADGLASGGGGSVFAPAAALTVACGCLAFLLAHRIVRPLGVLTAWLPNLRQDEREADPIPGSVSARGDEIGALARSLEEIHRRLRAERDRRLRSERLAALGRIATSLAHEIRNPVAAIRMHADLLARRAGMDAGESVALIREEVEQVDDLINQWLFVVRPEPPETGAHDFGELIGEIGRRLGAAMEHAGASLTISAPQSVRVACDRARVGQVMRNLLVNAMQAMPEGGRIRIAVEREGSDAVASIRDEGWGFSEEALRRFGEPFFSEREGGMGIGLTLAREVVVAHGGTIEAFNPAEGGALVRVRLPLASSPPLSSQS